MSTFASLAHITLFISTLSFFTLSMEVAAAARENITETPPAPSTGAGLEAALRVAYDAQQVVRKRKLFDAVKALYLGQTTPQSVAKTFGVERQQATQMAKAIQKGIADDDLSSMKLTREVANIVGLSEKRNLCTDSEKRLAIKKYLREKKYTKDDAREEYGVALRTFTRILDTIMVSCGVASRAELMALYTSESAIVDSVIDRQAFGVSGPPSYLTDAEVGIVGKIAALRDQSGHGNSRKSLKA